MVLRILKYIISIWLLSGLTAFTQVTPGLRIGVDVFEPALGFILGGRSGGEATVDFGLRHKYFFVAETGFQHSSIDSNSFHYKGYGAFLKVGVDKNLLNNPKFKGNDIITLGIRYGTCLMSNSASGIIVPASYWNPDPVSYDLPGSAFMSHWIELKAGIKAEVLKNFFIGWSLSGRLMLSSGHPTGLTPYLVPGFGRGDSKSVFGFNYYLCYRIPLKRAPGGT